MTQPDYEYTGAIAAYWDLLRGDTTGWSDRPFYKQAIDESGQPALDVGCGTGRLLLDYLQQGIDIDGVDNSPEMLTLCRQKAETLDLHPNLYEQTMESLELPRKYRTIIVPSSSFQLVTDRRDAALAMQRFFDHLEPGGTLVMPFMVLWRGSRDEPVVQVDWAVSGERARPDGATVRRWSRSTYDISQQLESTEDRYEILRDGQIVESQTYSRSPATLWYSQEQAIELYKQAGFSDIRLTRDFTMQPASESDALFCVFGTRPAVSSR